MKKMIWIGVCLVFTAAGAALPMFVDAGGLFGSGGDDAEPVERANVPFGEVTVNLSEERMTRYLRVSIVLEVDAEKVDEVTELVTKKEAELKNWLIGHLAGKSLLDVTGTAGVRRCQREILEKFEEMLYPDGGGELLDVLFSEFVVQ